MYWKLSSTKCEAYLAWQNAFCIKSAQTIMFCVENCLLLLPNYRHVLLKNAFCMKSAQSIQLAVENCVWLHFVLKTTFCQIISMSSQKMPFASNVLKEYNSLLKTVSLQFELKWSFFLAKKRVLNQMCSKNTTRCWKLCFTSVWVKVVPFSCYKMRFASNVLKEYYSLLKTVFHFILC